MTRDEIKTFILTMLEFYPSFKPTERTADAWLMCFANEEIKTLLTALKTHALESKWAPSVAEIVQIIEQARKPTGADWTASEALSYVQNLASRYHQMTSEEVASERMTCPKLTKDALRLVGFHRFLPKTYQYNPWITPEKPQQDPSGLFIKIYEQLQNREIDLRRIERLQAPERKVLGDVKKLVPGIEKLIN